MVTDIATQKDSLRDAFRRLLEMRPGAEAAWLNRLCQNAMARFEELGFPTTKEEEWKYTNVAPIARAGFTPYEIEENPGSTMRGEEMASFEVPETSDSQLIFVNGSLREDLSSLKSLPAEVVVMNLARAVVDERYSEIARGHLARHADYVSNSFTALNTAFVDSGAFIYVPKGVIVTAPLHLVFISNPIDTNRITFPRVLFVAEENSAATLIESYVSSQDSQYFTNSVTELVLKVGARLEHYKLQREGAQAFHVATTTADLGVDSSYDATTITFGAQLSRHDIQVLMDHEGAECWVDGLYLVTNAQHTDTHSVIDHRKPHCTSHQLYKGILDGKSRAVFNGKIFVRHDAQKTDAMQTNKNLLLSNEARVDTKPQLEILADDVKCAHGAAVGQIDEDELFYLETRGIHPDLARNLLTYGFAEEVIGKIKVDSIRAQLDEAVLNRLNARLEA